MAQKHELAITDADLPDNFTAHLDQISVRRPPEHVVAEAREAARELARVLAAKPQPVVVNGERYLEFDDWQMLGRFYGVTARVASTERVEFGEARGWAARAEAVRADGLVVGAAEAMCLDSEKRWREREDFQRRSMAQTRACAKALRSVLSWVAVLAEVPARGGAPGTTQRVRPTPAEELDWEPGADPRDEPPAKPGADPAKPPAPAGAPAAPPAPDATITREQQRRLFAVAAEAGWKPPELKAWLEREYRIASTAAITQRQFPRLMQELAAGGKP